MAWIVKKMGFFWNNIVQIISEIFRILRRHFFNIKKSLLQLYAKKENLWVFFADLHRNSQHYIGCWQNAKNYRAFQLSVRAHWVNGRFSCKQDNKKMPLYQQFDVDIVPAACNFIKNEAPSQVLSCEFCEFLQPLTLLKIRLQPRCFLVNLDTFFNQRLY